MTTFYILKEEDVNFHDYIFASMRWVTEGIKKQMPYFFPDELRKSTKSGAREEINSNSIGNARWEFRGE